jgi:hypothetical protein
MTRILLMGADDEPRLRDAHAVLRGRGEILAPGPSAQRADLVVGELPRGTRAVPAEIAAAARAAEAIGVLLWTEEPMVRPVTPVGAGNVVLVSPAHRGHVLAALDILLGVPAPPGRQAVHRAWWSGTVMASPTGELDDYQSESMGATFVHQGVRQAETPSPALLASQLIERAQTDARRGALLRDALGDSLALVHLAPGASHWLVSWPSHAPPLWVFSPLRLPMLWSLSATLAASESSFARFPSYPGDLMVAAALGEAETAELLATFALGSLDVLRALERLAHRPGDWGFVLEVR